MQTPRIKVCGVTREADLNWLADSGVDTIGINLVATSKRHVSLARGVELASIARDLNLKVVAVVMNSSADQLHQVCQQFTWDFVQLHGQEPPLLAKYCCGIPIIKAVAWSGLEEQRKLVQVWRRECDEAGRVAGSESKLGAFLLDAYAPGVGGGSGLVARWDLIYPRPTELEGCPLILAGGLTPQNVSQAIMATQVDGVDVASGVEDSPGQKCKRLTMEFARAAASGFAGGQ